MIKLANQIIDAYDDVLRDGLKKLASIAPDVQVMSADERAMLQDRDFALCFITKKASKLNKFPIHSADDTWLSNEYFDMNHSRLTEKAASIAAYHIKTACSKFGIKPKASVEQMAKEASSNVYVEEITSLEQHSPVLRVNTARFADIEKIAGNYTHAQYAFPNAGSVKLACQYFEKHAAQMPLQTRHKYAHAIQKRANELGMPRQEGLVAKYASDHYSPEIDAHLSSRMSLLEGKPDMQSQFSKLASVKSSLQPSQFAQMLHHLDKQAGLTKYYDSYLTDPYRSSFAAAIDPYINYSVKIASQVLTADEITTIAHAKYDKVKSYFGQTIADEFKKNPIPIFESLPNDSKELIAGIADGSH